MKNPKNKNQFVTLAFIGTVLAACGGGGGGGANAPASSPTVTITTPEVTVQSGQEISYCYYFHVPNANDMFMKQWRATFSAGVQRAALFYMEVDVQPEGTLSSQNCAPSVIQSATINNQVTNIIGTWAFSANRSGDEYQFPADDGTGKPVGLSTLAGQRAYVWIHMFNPTTGPLQVSMTLHGTAYPLNTAVTRADSFVTFNGNLNIPAFANKTEQRTCAVPGSDAKFISFTMHTNRQSVSTTVSAMINNVQTNLFEGTNWEAPGLRTFSAPDFFTPPDGRITYRCDYVNPTNRTITTGNSTGTDEMCMMLSHYFPAPRPRFCFNDILQQ